MRLLSVFLPGLLSVAALVATGCGDVSLTSTFRTAPITVDGRYDDWQGNMKFIEKINMSVGTMNDASDLYVILVVGDREVQQRIMMSGLFLWFDPAGGNDRQFAVHYPVGMGPPRESERPGSDRDRTGMREAFAKESLEEAELVGAGGTRHLTRSIDNLPGVEVNARQERGAMVFEYRIPLAADVDNPYGVGAVPGQAVGVGLLTPELDRGKVREQEGEWRRPPGDDDNDGDDGEGRGPGGMGGRSGMRPAGGFAGMPDPINVWATLKLAAVPR